jgi:hypothetical protein
MLVLFSQLLLSYQLLLLRRRLLLPQPFLPSS